MDNRELEFNEKCAFFVGARFELDSHRFVFDVELYDSLYTLSKSKRHHKEHLCFHEDWNWLVLVVQQIRKSGWRYDITHHGSVSKSEIINITIWRKYPGGGETILVDIEGNDLLLLTVDSIKKFFDKLKEI